MTLWRSSEAETQLFSTWPERPRPLSYPAVAIPLAIASPVLGGWMMENGPDLLDLAEAGLVGGATIGCAMATLETALPARSDLVAIARGSATFTGAAMAGAGLGAVLAARVGRHSITVAGAMEAGTLGTVAIVLGLLGLAMAGAIVGAFGGDPELDKVSPPAP